MKKWPAIYAAADSRPLLAWLRWPVLTRTYSHLCGQTRLPGINQRMARQSLSLSLSHGSMRH
eukprot:CAMPEP_0185910792 /NCGR_PEP_ID=MMETSP0196C-20130402/21778_1 /TAXON_ID=2932 /ORGANISM="Alexandrium fundyense, Strain CCMP1719" /LENGTH=61 /DNA_ID=CAMNT_0028631635 /DNA_START=28 /DNA_END=210 /DNA_ORIENTATION=+